LEEFEGGPLTAAEFASQHGLAVSTLYNWCRRSRRPRTGAPGQPPPAPRAFQQVSLAEVFSAGSHWVAEVSLPDGTQVRWKSQASVPMLQDLLAKLRRSC
jgi:transposase-like protein